MKFTSSFFLFCLLCCLSLSTGKSEPILIIALPQSDSEVSASWERGEEILPGALAVIEELQNNDSDSTNLTLVVANSGLIARYHLPYSGNVLEIIANLTWQKRLLDIVGIAGVLHPNVLAILNRFQLPLAPLMYFSGALHNSNIHYVTASTSTLVDSVLAFLTEVDVTKFGIITEIKPPYFIISSQLSTKANISFFVQFVYEHRKSFSDIADRVIASNIHVILLSVGPSAAVPVLCEAYNRGLTWPKYSWILHSYRFDDLLQSSEPSEDCNMQKILEGVVIFQLTEEAQGKCFNSKIILRNMGKGGFNPYAELLYSSVRTLISHFNQVSLPFHHNSKVYIYHYMNGSASLTGIYDGPSHTLTIVSEITFTAYELPIVYQPAALVPYLFPLPILCALFNTMLLVLYLVFRNEQSVKSTSVSLSMLIFVGCYLLIAYTVVLILHELHWLDLCMARIWLCGVGLSLPLILATILVKMLRVYRIFTVFKILKQSVHMSDFALFVYTLLIISPNIVLLILWTAVSRYHRISKFIEHAGLIRIEQGCYSDYSFIFFTLLFAYFFLLLAAVAIVAVKSRKIRHSHFKDTKKVNLVIFLLCIIATCTFAYWNIFVYADLYLASLIVTYTGHLFAALLCQMALFIPKLWPSIQKKITKCPIKSGLFNKLTIDLVTLY